MAAKITDKRCAFCVRWEGDAQLTGGPTITKGMVKFNTGAKGKCVKRGQQIEASQGAGCNDFEMDPKVRKYS